MTQNTRISNPDHSKVLFLLTACWKKITIVIFFTASAFKLTWGQGTASAEGVLEKKPSHFVSLFLEMTTALAQTRPQGNRAELASPVDEDLF